MGSKCCASKDYINTKEFNVDYSQDENISTDYKTRTRPEDFINQLKNSPNPNPKELVKGKIKIMIF